MQNKRDDFLYFDNILWPIIRRPAVFLSAFVAVLLAGFVFMFLGEKEYEYTSYALIDDGPLLLHPDSELLVPNTTDQKIPADIVAAYSRSWINTIIRRTNEDLQSASAQSGRPYVEIEPSVTINKRQVRITSRGPAREKAAHETFHRHLMSLVSPGPKALQKILVDGALQQLVVLQRRRDAVAKEIKGLEAESTEFEKLANDESGRIRARIRDLRAEIAESIADVPGRSLNPEFSGNGDVSRAGLATFISTSVLVSLERNLYANQRGLLSWKAEQAGRLFDLTSQFSAFDFSIQAAKAAIAGAEILTPVASDGALLRRPISGLGLKYAMLVLFSALASGLVAANVADRIGIK